MRLPAASACRHLFLVPLALLMADAADLDADHLDRDARRGPPLPAGADPVRASTGTTTRRAIDSAPFGAWYLNSVIVCAVVVLSNLVFCSLAAYAFARIQFFGRTCSSSLLLATLMVPFQVILIPTFLIVRHLGLIDSLGALIAPNLVNAFGIFMLRQFFRTLPVELEEAARIDGCSRLGVLVKIVLPLSAPGALDAGPDHAAVDVERLPLAAGRDQHPEPHDAAGRPLDVPGHAPDPVDDADGRQRARRWRRW